MSAIVSSTQALLRELGMTATSELRAMRQQLKELDLAAPSALGPEEQQRAFLELRGELRAERDFKSLLEAMPGISASTSWPLVKRKVRWRPGSLGGMKSTDLFEFGRPQARRVQYPLTYLIGI